MKIITTAAMHLSLAVLALVLAASACTSDRSVSHNDYYSTRVVKRKVKLEFTLPTLANRRLKGVHKNSVSATATDYSGIQSNTPISHLNINAMPSLLPADIASSNNMLFVNPAKERVTQKIRNLYQTETSVKSFRKGYKEIKRQTSAKFINAKSSKAPVALSGSESKGAGFGLASIALGVAGFFVSALICGALAIIFAIIGLRRGKPWFASIGLILGIIDLALGLAVYFG